MARYEKPDKQVNPADYGLPENLPDRIEVGDFQILVVTQSAREKAVYEEVVESLRGNSSRDWFVQHAYHCLPLTVANQTGFIVRALYSFEVSWNGGVAPADVTVTPLLSDAETAKGVVNQQIISPHFGMGTFTVQNRWHYRTGPGINLMTINPPNCFMDGVGHMNGIIETDNLRRDFTLNLKITRPDTVIRIEKGMPIGCILPYPRNFFDQFEMQLADEVIPAKHVNEERAAANLAGRERSDIDAEFKGGIGRRYMEGKDVFGNVFDDHQKTLHAPQEAARRYLKTRPGTGNADQGGTSARPSVQRCPVPEPEPGPPATKQPEDAGILHIRGLLSDEVCATLCDTWEELQALTSDESKTVPLFDKRVLHYRDIKCQRPLAAAYMKLSIDLVCEKLKSHFGSGDAWVDDIQIVKWWKGHRMPPHADKENPDGSLHPTPWRDFAAVLYLNKEYEGGAIEFPELGKVLRPSRGDVVCFRGDLEHTHGVQLIESGERYTMPCWFTLDESRKSPDVYEN